MLTGTEVKALRRAARRSSTGSRSSTGNELWLEGVHIPEYLNGTWTNHAPRRRRKLLLHRDEIEKIATTTRERGRTVVPLQLYFKDGRAKVEIALATRQARVRQAQRPARAAGPAGGRPRHEHPRVPVRVRLLALGALLLAAAAFVGLPATAYAAAEAGAPAYLPAANASFDRMSSFRADYVLDAEGGATVTETIDYAFGTSAGAKHGILRNIVTRQAVTDDNGKASTNSYRYYALDLENVTSPSGAPTQTKVTDQSGGTTQIRVGDPDVTVSGTQSYVLTYHLANVMNPFPDHAEFFYNVFLGDSVPKDKVTVTVTGPGGVTEVNCVRGSDPGKACDRAEAGTTATFVADNLLGNEDLTIATSLPRAGFGELKPDLRAEGSAYDEGQAKVLTSLALAGGIGAPLVAAGVMGVLVATRGRDEWYAGVTPGLTRVRPTRSPPAASRRRRSRPCADASPRSPCSSTRRPASSPGWSARSSTSPRTPSTSRRRSWTSRCAGSSRSRRSRAGRCSPAPTGASSSNPRRPGRRCARTRPRSSTASSPPAPTSSCRS